MSRRGSGPRGEAPTRRERQVPASAGAGARSEPVAREKLLATLRDGPVEGYRLSDLVELFGLGVAQRPGLRLMLAALTEEGVVERGSGHRYGLPGAKDEDDDDDDGDEPLPPPVFAIAQVAARADAVAKAERELRRSANTGQQADGLLRMHPDGYGFVERDPGLASVFVPARYVGSAMDGDRVSVGLRPGQKGIEGWVERILERGRKRLTGIVRSQGGRFVLEPDDPRVSGRLAQIALDGDVPREARDQTVVADIVRYQTDAGPGVTYDDALARVSRVLGDPQDPRTEIEKILISGDIPVEFPPQVKWEAKEAPDKVRKRDLVDRVDLRDREFLTIDPKTARDFDDAVCIETHGTGTRLWVAVADVSHYVTPGSAIDTEAQGRGVSVYLPDRAIPMLPEALSSHICSLVPNEDRCAMVAQLDYDANARLVGVAFCAAVIRSRQRLDYQGVGAALAGNMDEAGPQYAPWLDTLRRLRDLARKLRAARAMRGALELEVPEVIVLLDEDDPLRVRDVVRSKADPREREAYQLVEECMLAANFAVAEYFQRKEADAMWRIHDVPAPEKLEDLATVASAFGLDADGQELADPKALVALLQEVKGHTYERALNFMLLRSLKQATYDVVNIGHFGLAALAYVHFTSPIRRYPDLIIHRLLKHHLRSEGRPAGGANPPPPPSREQLTALAGKCSRWERRAVDAEREAKDMYRAHLMREHVGDELGGMISAVTAFGFFVQCDTPFVEGLVRVDQLGEPVTYDERIMQLQGLRSGRVFRLGDVVKVRVEDVSVARRQIQLALTDDSEVNVRRPVPAGSRRGGKGAAVSERPARNGWSKSERSAPTTTRRTEEARRGKGGGPKGRGAAKAGGRKKRS